MYIHTLDGINDEGDVSKIPGGGGIEWHDVMHPRCTARQGYSMHWSRNFVFFFPPFCQPGEWEWGWGLGVWVVMTRSSHH